MRREELIALCEAAIRPERVWHDRDSEAAHRQVGEAWALLRAGCDFEIADDKPNFGGKTVWVRIRSRGFSAFEHGDDSLKRDDTFYLPTQERLDDVGEGDWY